MIYAMSDIHGCYEKYSKMLEKINFNDNDTLYILGDSIDRGDDGIKILQDVIKRNNIIHLRGNHEFLGFYSLRRNISPYNLDDDEFIVMFRIWLMDGGAVTYDKFLKIDESEQAKLIKYEATLKYKAEIEVGGKKFHLSHTIPNKERMLNEQLNNKDYIWGEPEYDKQYYDGIYLVTGHTPTGLIDPDFTGKIFTKNNHIAIDCGAAFGNPLGCICLNTLEEFYV